LKILGRLMALGANVRYHDPYVPQLVREGLSSTELEPALADADLAVIVTAHPGIDHAAIAATHPTVDLRGVTRHARRAPQIAIPGGKES
jgi:UDP-N-acetyl-D-glucosamine dehydrogenase